MTDYREILFRNYASTHIKNLDANEQEKVAGFVAYAERNYRPLISSYNREDTMILEIGCNRGYLLMALSNWGFQNLVGIDMSPDDVGIAQKLVPDAEITCEDAFEYLPNYPQTYDLIFIKATLEHIPKDQIFPLLEAIAGALTNGGMVVVDVPNMDWLFASHERYMDFTHEVGFTKESLRQVMSNIFPHVDIIPAENIAYRSRFLNFRKNFARFILSTLLHWADETGAQNPIWARSLIGTGKKN